jgi:hypothetical protein
VLSSSGHGLQLIILAGHSPRWIDPACRIDLLHQDFRTLVNLLPVIVSHTVRFPTAAGRAEFLFACRILREAGIIADQTLRTVLADWTRFPPAARAGFLPVDRIVHEPGTMTHRAPGTILVACIRFPPTFNAYFQWSVVPGSAVRTEPHNRDLDAAG